MLFPSFFSLSIRIGGKKPFVKFVPPPPVFFASAVNLLLFLLSFPSPTFLHSNQKKIFGKNLSRKNRFWVYFAAVFTFAH